MLAAMAAGTALWGFAPEAQAMDEIMPLEELEPGMTGELYTVADGSGDISSFEVTILGVMQNGNPCLISLRAAKALLPIRTAG